MSILIEPPDTLAGMVPSTKVYTGWPPKWASELNGGTNYLAKKVTEFAVRNRP